MTTKTNIQHLQNFQTSEESLKPFTFNITEHFFAKTLADQPAVQDALTSLETDESNFLRQFHTYHSNKLKDTGRFMEDRKEAEDLKILIDQTERNLAEDTTPSIKALHEQTLSELNLKLKKIQSRIDHRDSTKVFSGHVSSQINDVVARGLENLAVQLGEWFATGVVGPGTVTYRGRKFTAE